MSDRELLEHILYELRLANWQRAGGKKAGEPPQPPPELSPTARSFGGQVYNITIGDVDDAKRREPPESVA